VRTIAELLFLNRWTSTQTQGMCCSEINLLIISSLLHLTTHHSTLPIPPTGGLPVFVCHMVCVRRITSIDDFNADDCDIDSFGKLCSEDSLVESAARSLDVMLVSRGWSASSDVRVNFRYSDGIGFNRPLTLPYKHNTLSVQFHFTVVLRIYRWWLYLSLTV